MRLGIIVQKALAIANALADHTSDLFGTYDSYAATDPKLPQTVDEFYSNSAQTGSPAHFTEHRSAALHNFLYRTVSEYAAICDQSRDNVSCVVGLDSLYDPKEYPSHVLR